MVHLLLQHGAKVHASQDAALREACEMGRADVVQLLIQHGANVQCARGGEALRKASQNGHPQVVELLIQHGARMPVGGV